MGGWFWAEVGKDLRGETYMLRLGRIHIRTYGMLRRA